MTALPVDERRTSYGFAKQPFNCVRELISIPSSFWLKVAMFHGKHEWNTIIDSLKAVQKIIAPLSKLHLVVVTNMIDSVSKLHLDFENTPSFSFLVFILSRVARTQPLTQKFSCWRTSTRSCHTGQPVPKCNGWASPWGSRLIDREMPPAR